MSTVTPYPLPDDPSLEQLRKQAKDVRDLARAGIPGALDLVAAHHPKGAHAVTLTGAQLVVARHYGFSSWAALKTHLAVIEQYRREPDTIDPARDGAGEGAGGGASLAERFLALACLRYGGDDRPERWAEAATLLRAHPDLAQSDLWVAAAAADTEALQAHLAEDRDRTGAAHLGGPFRWEPLLYLAYARHDPAVTEEAALGTARLLLDHGADPNAGYLWHGLTSPFTALTGALGSGEGDQPEHPHAIALARLLLDAGADANDSQALYNRQFRPDDRHLVLLLAYGLGKGDGGPWRARLGQASDSPTTMLRQQLWWAIVHDMTARVRLLVDGGADILTPYAAPGGRPSGLRTSHNRTPAEVAALAGCPDVVDLLVARGARRPASDGVDGFIAAAMAGNRDEAARLASFAPEAKAQRPGLMVWAAARGNHCAIVLLSEAGFDINAKARADIPMEQAWETALHQAAGAGNVDLARLLLDLGADPNILDGRFDSTPLGWARHFDHPELVELLEPLTGHSP